MIGQRGKRWVRIAEIRNPDCELCPLNNSSKHVCVMGRGSSVAKIMLIGEAPGEAESETGQPFMGAAGQVLNELLEENHMKHMVYITNICKCRPPENRKPKPEERDVCQQTYLRKEMYLLMPTVLVLLGKTPIETWFGKNEFKRGLTYPFRLQRPDNKWLEYTVIPTYHPAYYLHSGSQVALAQLKQHLLAAKEISCASTRTP